MIVLLGGEAEEVSTSKNLRECAGILDSVARKRFGKMPILQTSQQLPDNVQDRHFSANHRSTLPRGKISIEKLKSYSYDLRKRETILT